MSRLSRRGFLRASLVAAFAASFNVGTKKGQRAMANWTVVLSTPRPPQGINISLLKEEAAAAFGSRFVDANETDYGATVSVYLTSSPDQAADQATWDALVLAHDPTKQSYAQKRIAAKDQALATLTPLVGRNVDSLLLVTEQLTLLKGIAQMLGTADVDGTIMLPTL